MTEPEPPPPTATPAQAPLDYARPNLDRRERSVWRQMAEAFGMLVVASLFTVGVALAYSEYSYPARQAVTQGGLAAGTLAFVAVLVVTELRKAWRGLLFVLLLLIGIFVLLLGLCFAAFARV